MKLQYRPEIDGLRTIAVLSVLIYHAEIALGSTQFLKGGFLGVDIFFVISGFLITNIIMEEYRNSGHFSISNFYERRARRLLPALLVVMLMSLPFAWFYLLPTQLVDFSKSLVSSLLFGSNFYWLDTMQEYGAESALLKPFLHTWSLAVEEQYYIVFPLILVAIYKWYKDHTVVLLAAGLLLSLQFSDLMSLSESSFSFYMLPSRFWELLAGGLLANILYLHPQKENDALLNRTMPILGLFLIFHSLVFISFSSNHPGFITLLPVIGTVLIIWFANKDELVTKVLSSKLFVWVGLISYSLYLWHYPIFAFGRLIDLSPTWHDKFQWIFLTFILSVTTYFFVEKPFRNRKKVSKRFLVVSLIFMSLIVLTFSVYTVQNGGLKDRFPDRNKLYGKNEPDNVILKKQSWSLLAKVARDAGFNKRKQYEKEFLGFSSNNQKTKLLIIGNSHSKDLYNAFYQNQGLFSNLEIGRYNIQISDSDELIQNMILSPNFKAADVVLISTRYRVLGKKNNFINDVKSLPNFLTMLKNTGKRVIVASNTMEFQNIDKKPIFDWYIKQDSIGPKYSKYELKQEFYKRRAIKRVKEINAKVKSIVTSYGMEYRDKFVFICNNEQKQCDGITPDGYKSFYDYGHWTLEGAKHFGSRLYELDWLDLG